MNVLIQLSHPAHFHLYKIVAKNLMEDRNKVLFVIKSKDILETLLQNAGLPYVNINQHAHRGSKFGILWDMFVREWRIIKLCLKHKIDLITGSTPETAHVSWLLRIHGVNTGEDDLDVDWHTSIRIILHPIRRLSKHTASIPPNPISSCASHPSMPTTTPASKASTPKSQSDW